MFVIVSKWEKGENPEVSKGEIEKYLMTKIEFTSDNTIIWDGNEFFGFIPDDADPLFFYNENTAKAIAEELTEQKNKYLEEDEKWTFSAVKYTPKKVIPAKLGGYDNE